LIFSPSSTLDFLLTLLDYTSSLCSILSLASLDSPLSRFARLFLLASLRSSLALTDKWFAAQSLDNQILIYSTDNFRQNRKKRFAGHTVAGYACAIGFSPDGRFLSSGDGQGNVVFWDWKSGKILKRLYAHKQVVIDHVWLPHQHVRSPLSLSASLLANPSPQSKLITASWDGLIKLWE
jgi:pre-mRNA-processing factor 17